MDELTSAATSPQTVQQVVVFRLASETYGVDIESVQEIIRMQNVTRVPSTPDFVEGVINLRGKVVPVVDFRKRFGLVVSEQDKHSRIVVMNISGQDIGLIVDEVTEVLRISVECVEPPSSMITSDKQEYLLGIAKLDDRLIILLDLERVFSDEEKGLIA